MVNKGLQPVSITYSAWLAAARQTSDEQQFISVVFAADNTAVSFNKISYATCKVMPDAHAAQE